MNTRLTVLTEQRDPLQSTNASSVSTFPGDTAHAERVRQRKRVAPSRRRAVPPRRAPKSTLPADKETLTVEGGESGILHELVRRQRSLAGNEIERGYRFLSRAFDIDHCYQPVLSRDCDFQTRMELPTEIFTSAVILDLLRACPSWSPRIQDRIVEFLGTHHQSGSFNYFEDTRFIPDDVDCTGLALAQLLTLQAIAPETAHQATTRVLENVDSRGIVHVYLPPRREREGQFKVEAVPCANVLYLAYLQNREEEAGATEQYLMGLLESGEFESPEHLYYYLSPDVIVFWAARMLVFDRFRARWSHVIEQALRRRIGKTADPLDLAFRAIAGNLLGIDTGEKDLLRCAQQADGSWPIRPFFKLGRSAVYIGAEALTTAFALCALDCPRQSTTTQS